jgi:hypothetical protein
MTRTVFRIITAVFFAVTALVICALIIFPAPWKAHKEGEARQTRIVIPQALRPDTGAGENTAELMTREEMMTVKVPLNDGEIMAALLNDDFNGDQQDEQIVAYRSLLEIESPIYLTYIDYDRAAKSYERVWNAPTAATRAGTVSLYTQDLIGDRSTCILLSGMNGDGEHTLTIFRMASPAGTQAAEGSPPSGGGFGFSKIAELRIDGSISVRETARSQAYQMGLARGAGYTITAYGRDHDSSNIMDQVEITYAYDETSGLYEQTGFVRLPGTQIEQRRVRELLENPRAFEEFITGLWYYVSPQGSIDSRQYIYFDPPAREIIFFGEETQQVFSWQNSSPTRYGLYLASQNISVSTLRRSIDIELESLESIRIKVFEDVRLKFSIGVSAPWDGSYRKANLTETGAPKPARGRAYIDAVYDGPIGKIRFFPEGNYELNAGNGLRRGNYAFFYIGGRELLELRPESRSGTDPEARETYLLEPSAAGETPPDADVNRKSLTLLRVRLGARGIQELHEGAIALTLSEG